MVRYCQIKAVLKASSLREYLPRAPLWNLLSLIRQSGQRVAEWLCQVTKETHLGLIAPTIDAVCERDLQGGMLVLISSQTLAHIEYCEGTNAHTQEPDYIHTHAPFSRCEF